MSSSVAGRECDECVSLQSRTNGVRWCAVNCLSMGGDRSDWVHGLAASSTPRSRCRWSGASVAIGPRPARLVEMGRPGARCAGGRTALVTGPTSGLGRATAARSPLSARASCSSAATRPAASRRRTWPASPARRVPVGGGRHGVPGVGPGGGRTESWPPSPAGRPRRQRRRHLPRRAETADGIEATLAMLVVGPVRADLRLLPLLRALPTAPRVIAVTSGGMYAQPVHLDDLEWRTRRSSARVPMPGRSGSRWPSCANGHAV